MDFSVCEGIVSIQLLSPVKSAPDVLHDEGTPCLTTGDGHGSLVQNSPLVALCDLDSSSIRASPHAILPDCIHELRGANDDALFRMIVGDLLGGEQVLAVASFAVSRGEVTSCPEPPPRSCFNCCTTTWIRASSAKTVPEYARSRTR
jgi:hypothetical protein